jgi:hypothetical protein
METKENSIALEHLNKMQNTLKKVVLYLGLGLVFGIGLFIYLYSKKDKTSTKQPTPPTTSISQQIKQITSSLPKICEPFDVIHKDQYISIHSKSCNKLRIINTYNFKILELDI